MLNDSSRVFEDAMSDDATGAVTGAVLVLAARASSGVVDGAVVVSGVGGPVPLLSGMAGAGLVGSGFAATTLAGVESTDGAGRCAAGRCGGHGERRVGW